MAPPSTHRGRAPIATYPYGIDWRDVDRSHARTVGVVMRTQGRPLLLPRALESVVAQTFDDWQLVVVNHGGPRDVVETAVSAVAGRASGEVEVLHLDVGGGMERATNAGLERLDTTYYAVHDDDDSWMPTFLERTVGFLEDPANSAFGAVTTRALKRWERIEDGRVETIEDEGLNTEATFVDVQQLFGWNRIFTINTLFRSALRDVVGPYNEQLTVVGDWEFHIRVAAVTEVGFIPEVLARYHLRHLGGDARYRNTVVDEWTLHRELDARLRGALLRRFLDGDPSRLGLLVALSHDAELTRASLERLEETVRLVDWRTHHTGERINDVHDQAIVRIESAIAALSQDVQAVRADTDRIRRTLALLGSPTRPLRRARQRWRTRRGGSAAPDGDR